MSTLLQIRDVKKHFPVVKGRILSKVVGSIRAVDGVSFYIKKGETFGLVGESGSGKTTIAKLILLLEEITSGFIFFRNKEISEFTVKDLHEYRSSVQAVFQNPTSSLNPRMRVGSSVTEPLLASNLLPRNVIKERMEKTLTMVGLGTEASMRFPHEFSGGQRQRIALARALSVYPDLIILDEPVSALDVSIQAQILNLLKDLQAELGVAYLFIAHNLAAVRYMSHRIGVMYLGKLVEQGEAEKVYLNRKHPYTQALFSAALPSHPDMVREEIVLSGEIPSAFKIPSGCPFHPRCKNALPICFEIVPEVKEVSPGHYFVCHLPLTD